MTVNDVLFNVEIFLFNGVLPPGHTRQIDSYNILNTELNETHAENVNKILELHHKINAVNTDETETQHFARKNDAVECNSSTTRRDKCNSVPMQHIIYIC